MSAAVDPAGAWAEAGRRWSEAAGLLRAAGTAPVALREWLGAGWTGAAADGFDSWGAALDRATRRMAAALDEAAGLARAVALGSPAGGVGAAAGAAGAGGAGPARAARAVPSALGEVRLGLLDDGARAVAAVPVPGEAAPDLAPRRDPGPAAAPRRPVPAPRRPAPVRPAPAHRAAPGNRDERVRGWIAEATAILREQGYRPEQMDPDAIASVIRHESAGDPAAVNRWDANAARGTPSMGLMQVIGPTFGRYALPGHGDPMDPVDNIVAGVRYAIARYGSVSRVPGLVSLAAGGAYRGY